MWKTISLCFFMLFATEMFAQWDYGAYVNMTRVKLKGDSPKDFSYQAGYNPNFGGIINYYFKEDARISFQPGYALNRSVLRYRDRELDEKRDSINLNLDYIRLPFYLDIISDNDKWHYLAGIDFQLALNQEGEAVGSEDIIDLNDDIRNFNPVVIFGLGRRIPLWDGVLNVDLRFGQSILNITDIPDDETSLVPRIKTSTFELLLAYEFNLHRKKSQ